MDRNSSDPRPSEFILNRAVEFSEEKGNHRWTQINPDFSRKRRSPSGCDLVFSQVLLICVHPCPSVVSTALLRFIPGQTWPLAPFVPFRGPPLRPRLLTRDSRPEPLAFGL